MVFHFFQSGNHTYGLFPGLAAVSLQQGCLFFRRRDGNGFDAVVDHGDLFGACASMYHASAYCAADCDDLITEDPIDLSAQELLGQDAGSRFHAMLCIENGRNKSRLGRHSCGHAGMGMHDIGLFFFEQFHQCFHGFFIEGLILHFFHGNDGHIQCFHRIHQQAVMGQHRFYFKCSSVMVFQIIQQPSACAADVSVCQNVEDFHSLPGPFFLFRQFFRQFFCQFFFFLQQEVFLPAQFFFHFSFSPFSLSFIFMPTLTAAIPRPIKHQKKSTIL